MIILVTWWWPRHRDDGGQKALSATGVAGLPGVAAPGLRVWALHHHHLLHPGPGGLRELGHPRDILAAAHRGSGALPVQQQQGGQHHHPRQLLQALPPQRGPHQGQHRWVVTNLDISYLECRRKKQF